MSYFVNRIKNRIMCKLFGFNEIYENVNRAKFTKNCLILYITAPFKERRLSNEHQNFWQTKELTKIVGEFGYNVDVIDYNAAKIKFNKKYDLIIDLHPRSSNIYSDFLAERCVRIAYITGSNPDFSNGAEQARIEALLRRRGTCVQDRRKAQLLEKDVLESFAAMFFIGNPYNLNSFSGYNLPQVFFIKNTGYDFLHSEEFSNKSPTNFLFLASTGQVHKGLDLLLEIFARKKHLNLFVLSLYEKEEDFCKIYEKELFNSTNIHPMGFLDIKSKEFRSVIQKCSYVLLPSCSEGISGSVLTAMSGGLIPLVSRECGFEDDEVNHFEDCSLESLSSAIESFSRKSLEWIAAESKRTVEIVRTRYNENNYKESIRAALRQTLYWQWSSFEDLSFPYITGNGFASQCKYIWNYDGFKVNPTKENNWVFVKTDYVKDFFENCPVKESFVIFSHNSDYSIDSSYESLLNDPRVIVWFAQNVDFNHPKLKPIPIGVANAGYSHGDIEVLNRVQSELVTKSALFYANYSINNNRAERAYCLKQTGVPLPKDINGGWKGFAGGYKVPNTFEGYLKDISRAYFCVSPKGNGIDCHRTWEALYVRTIPIVTKSQVVSHYKNFPIVILDDWSEFKKTNFTPELYYKIWDNFDITQLHIDNYLKTLLSIIEQFTDKSSYN